MNIGFGDPVNMKIQFQENAVDMKASATAETKRKIAADLLFASREDKMFTYHRIWTGLVTTP